MRRAALAVLVVGAVSLAACKEDPVPLSARANYTVCSGLHGTCSGDGCCALEHAYHLSSEARVECEVRAGDMPDTYRLNFSIQSPSLEYGPGIEGSDLQFNSAGEAPQPLRSCGDFAISEDGNVYPAEACDRLDVETDSIGGGGCEIEAFVNESEEVRGQFQCKELQLPAESTYLSVIYNHEVGWGEFVITGCNFRL